MICPNCKREHTEQQIGQNLGFCPICKIDLTFNSEVNDYVTWYKNMRMWDRKNLDC